MKLHDSSGSEATRWSLIGQALDNGSPAGREALDELLRIYMPALREHLVRRRRCQPERADDILHDFVINRILEMHLLRSADPARGKFRHFLQRCLDNFLIDRIRSEQSRTHAPETMLSIDSGTEGPIDVAGKSDGEPFDVTWAHMVIRQALDLYLQTCRDQGAHDKWLIFCQRLLVPLFTGDQPLPYEKLIETCGYRHPKQAANAFVTATRMFEKCLKSVIGQYVDGPQQIDAELRELARVASFNTSVNLLSDEVSREIVTNTALDQRPFSLTAFFSLNPLAGTSWDQKDVQAMFDHLLNCPLKHVLEGEEMTNAEKYPTVGDLLRADDPPALLLDALKRYGKELSEQARILPNTVGRAIYHLATATALVRRGIRLSKQDKNKLRRGIMDVMNRVDLDGHLAQTAEQSLQLLC